MRAVIQTVSSASVTVEEQVVGSIESGLLVLLGVTHDDTVQTAKQIAGKIWNLRIMAQEKSASDLGAPILLVSQFTLYADTRKGRRPSWKNAAPGPVSEPLVEATVAALRDLGAKVETGQFGAFMEVASVNQGPNTIILEL
ncbi:D-aminoacyl-tRNA deacylase [Natronoglycomyces albus]|uniref:D-aminoacyl-tRNA deacylase n=1 Tax=Natronoglycomyces albus TaxID=2811108 RepID=A0A895XM11_9ACTN|nr:D-aminoacyl-tRNA deacylase [Natronoglycomyces albus]QSB06384.1 D-tyrosyl-tRNA(Tyr) deacylase [Natronoglycomyces albus]